MAPHASVAVFILLTVFISKITSWPSSERCPPRSKVYSSSPVCQSDRDCQKYGNVCCPNSFNTKTCVEPAPYKYGSGYEKNQAGGPGVYCEGVKCSPYEVCKPDPVTKRLKCQRA